MNKIKMEVVYKNGDKVMVDRFEDVISGLEVDKRYHGRVILVRYK